MMDNEFNLITAIRIILKWKKQIVITVAASGIIAALFSVFVMDEWFLSWATFYPTNQAQNDRAAIFNSEAAAQVEYFGNKADVNRVLTIANSNPVIDFVIDSFHLAQHYDIDVNKPYWKTKVRKKFEKKYEAIKTEHDAVQISLYDTDPKLAAAIVNTVVKKVDELNKEHVNDSKKKVANAIALQIVNLQQTVNSYIDTLALLGQQYKIKVSSGADGTVIVDGNDYHAVQLYKAFMSKQTNSSRELNNLINIKGQIDVSLKNNESSLFILEEAFPADRREKPVRSLVVLITMLITIFVSVIGVLLIEQIREIKAQL
jgi:capsular polysaccharide biosynthesis protein